MTIQLIAQWNGYEQHGVYTLSAAEEARLIGLGLARRYIEQATDVLLHGKVDSQGLRLDGDASEAVRSAGAYRGPSKWPFTTRAVPGVWQRPADIGSWAWLRLLDTKKTPCIASPLGRYYLYFATDHNARGGIRLAYSDSLYSGWQIYRGGLGVGDNTIIYEDLDKSAGRAISASTETPSPVYDASINKVRIYYHPYSPSYGNGSGPGVANPTDPSGSITGGSTPAVEQGTLCVTSSDGLVLTKDRTFALDNWSPIDQHGVGLHTGYFNPFFIDGTMYAYHIGGGGDSGSCMLSYARTTDLGSLVTERQQLDRNARALYEAGRPNELVTWHGGRVVKTARGLYFLGPSQSVNSGGAQAASQALITFPIRGDMRTLDGPINVIDTTYMPGGFIDDDEGGLVGVFAVDDQMGIYHVR